MKQKKILAITALLAFLGGCTSQATVNAYSQLDPYQRTITVMAPEGDLTQRIDNVLRQNDYFVGDARQAVRNPRYSMQLSYSSSGMEMCFPNFDPKYDYDLTITDLRTGGHVFAMHGADCRHTILEQLDAYIKNRPM